MAGVGTGHGGTLAGGQDADRPDNQRRIAEAAAQPDAAFVNVNGQRVGRVGKSVGVIQGNIGVIQAQIVDLKEKNRR